MDLLASHQAGWENTVAVSGTAFTPEHAQLIRRMTDNLVLALDADQAGIKAAGRAARAALQGGLNVKVAALPEGLDPADLILREGAEKWKAAIRDSKDIITFLLDVLEKHAKSVDNFRRSVEVAVLPFLADVRSPIAREAYVREIANRLSVSEAAVSEAFSKTPKSLESRVPEDDPRVIVPTHDRARQAFAMYLWQRSLPKSTLDLPAYEKQLEEAIGPEDSAALRGLPEADLERLRFSAESLHGGSGNLEREADVLLSSLLRERLARELALASDALKRAEALGDEAQIDILMKSTQLLTDRIAKFHKPV
jgi:DNA primase